MIREYLHPSSRNETMDESSAQAPPGSDAELITAIASGDSAAYDMLRARHAAAACDLAGLLSADPAVVAEIVSETFKELRDVLRDGGGPRVALRPYLFTAVRWTAYRRGAGQPETSTPPADGDFSEPLFDPAIADLVRSPLRQAFGSLPESWRAALWHVVIEQAGPAQTGEVLGLDWDQVAALTTEALEGLREAYLTQQLSGVTRDDCRAALQSLGPAPDGTAPDGTAPDGAAEPEGLQHLLGCTDCRAVADDLADLGESLRRLVAPVFLGPAAAAYLALAELRIGGLRSIRRDPHRGGRARSRQVLTVGGGLLVVFAGTGLALTLTAAASPPQHVAAVKPAAAAHLPSSPPPGSTVPGGGPGSPVASPSEQANPPGAVTNGAAPQPSPTAPPSSQPSPTPQPTLPSPTPQPTVTLPVPPPTPPPLPPPPPTPTPSPTPPHHHHPATTS
jgi:DNA-directed RNA polymerase specialized sigma24 family protein